MALFVLGRANFYASRLLLTAAAALSVAPKVLMAEFCSSGKCNDEVEKAKLASEAAEKYQFQPQDTIFGKILRKEVPADIIYEDEKVSAREKRCFLIFWNKFVSLTFYRLHWG